MLAFILLYLLTLHEVTAGVLVRRDSNTTTCVGLTVKSNNGNRKVAIVIDSSGSMAESDPDNLRLAAGKSLNDWLITKNEAVGGKKEDLVTVINFDDEATLDYPLGDPSGADSAFDNIGADGGTFIAGGVEMAIAQLTTSSSGTTSGRSAIVVFTDGEVSRSSLVAATSINFERIPIPRVLSTKSTKLPTSAFVSRSASWMNQLATKTQMSYTRLACHTVYTVQLFPPQVRIHSSTVSSSTVSRIMITQVEAIA